MDYERIHEPPSRQVRTLPRSPSEFDFLSASFPDLAWVLVLMPSWVGLQDRVEPGIGTDDLVRFVKFRSFLALACLSWVRDVIGQKFEAFHTIYIS